MRSNSTGQPDRANARKHERNETKRFPGCPRSPTSDICIGIRIGIGIGDRIGIGIDISMRNSIGIGLGIGLSTGIDNGDIAVGIIRTLAPKRSGDTVTL